jgi:mannitol-1-/sugar-/sorbitol-6-/2-deoxyglucose-6-phosphatase
MSVRLKLEMIDAVIFDMDGVLLDSEPFWQDSEMEIFSTVGIQLSRAQCIETTGLPVIDVVAYRYKQHPWENKPVRQVAEEIVDGVIRRVRDRAVLLDGVQNVLGFFENKRIPMALASSSAMRLIETVLDKLSLKKYFKAVHSADDENYGKPHPAVFITTAKLLGVEPTRCVVFEDSFNGLIAAKAASMKTVVIPMASQRNEPRFDIADLKLGSMSEFSEDCWNKLNEMV